MLRRALSQLALLCSLTLLSACLAGPQPEPPTGSPAADSGTRADGGARADTGAGDANAPPADGGVAPGPPAFDLPAPAPIPLPIPTPPLPPLPPPSSD